MNPACGPRLRHQPHHHVPDAASLRVDDELIRQQRGIIGTARSPIRGHVQHRRGGDVQVLRPDDLPAQRHPVVLRRRGHSTNFQLRLETLRECGRDQWHGEDQKGQCHRHRPTRTQDGQLQDGHRHHGPRCNRGHGLLGQSVGQCCGEPDTGEDGTGEQAGKERSPAPRHPQPQQIAGLGQPSAQFVDRPAEFRGGFVLGLPLQVARHQRCAPAFAEPAEFLVQHPEDVVPLGAAAVGFGGRTVHGSLGCGQSFDLLHPQFFVECLSAHLHRHTVKPVGQRGSVRQRLPPASQHEEHGLKGFLGQRVLRDGPPTDAPHQRPVFGHELGEGSVVSTGELAQPAFIVLDGWHVLKCLAAITCMREKSGNRQQLRQGHGAVVQRPAHDGGERPCFG